MTKFKDIKAFYKPTFEFNLWFSRMPGASFLCRNIEETWYNGQQFTAGFFAFIQFKIFAMHLNIDFFKLRKNELNLQSS